MAEPQHFIVASAGHVDHGKSALVKALTGIDPDRLPEEKARGITIDLGFAQLELPALTPGAASIQLGIVDVPGHEDFVKNMVAGVGSIDLALFVVAADDGWMPQTEEHLQILSYLGVNRAVIALTKIDLIQDEHRAAAAIHDRLRGTPFADAPIVPTSVVTGHGIDDLKAALTRVLTGVPSSRDVGKPRLPVDRVFTLRGIGTVVTGTLTGGAFRCGQSIAIQPSGKVARIRNIQSHNRDVEIGVPGTRTALNLADLSAIDDVRRGDAVTLAEFGGPSEILDVVLEISPRANRPLRDGSHVRIHHGSSNAGGTVAFFLEKSLSPGGRALAQLRLDSSIFVFAGDRFVIRDSTAQNTLAGGIVLDPEPPRKMFRSEARLDFLRRRAESPNEVAEFVASQILRDRAVRPSKLLVESKFSAEEIAQALSRLATQNKVVFAGEFAVDGAAWAELRQRAADAIEASHRAHPEQVGLSLSDLRMNLEPHLPFPALFEFLVGDLCRSGFAQAGNAIHRSAHQPSLPPLLQAAATHMRADLRTKPFDPPSRKQLAPDSISQQALRYLIQKGELVEINSELVFAAENLKHMTESIRKYIQDHGPATVSQLRQSLGCSRRIIVPLLERLDREGVTVRDGDFRKLRSKQDFTKPPVTK